MHLKTLILLSRRSQFVTEAHGSGNHAVKEIWYLIIWIVVALQNQLHQEYLMRRLRQGGYKSIWMSREHHLSGYKNIRNIYPQATITTGALTFNFGALISQLKPSQQH